MHAVILSRVSSEEQKLGFSPEAQTDNCFEYAKSHGLEVIHNSQFDESASYMSKKGKREKFWEVIDVIVKNYKVNKARIALVCDTVDRLQRGYREFGMLEEMILNNQLEIHFVSDKLMVNKDNLYEEEGKRWRNLVNEAFNTVFTIRKHAQKGMKKARQNNIVFKVPDGYIRKNGEVSLSDSSDLISEAFNMFSSGNYTQAGLTAYLNEKGYKTVKGKKLLKQTLYGILRNPFYYGMAKSKYGNYAHLYPPLTTEHIFEKCQKVLNQISKSGKKQQRNFKEYSFRNLLTCSGCGRTINPDGPKKGKYIYYRCVNSDCAFKQQVVKEETLLEKAENILEKLKFSDQAIEFVVEKLKSDFNQDSLYQKQRRLEVHNEIEKLEQRKNSFLDLLADGSITRDDYSKKRDELESKIYELNIEQTKLTRESTEIHLGVEMMFSLIKRLPEIFKSSNTSEKNQILKYLISNSTQSGQKVDLNVKKPFLFLYNNAESQHWLGDTDSNCDSWYQKPKSYH